MNVGFTRNFEKQIDGIRDSKLRVEVSQIVRAIMSASSLEQIPNIKKLKGFKTAYRIRSGNYRIGIALQNEKVIFVAFAHRKDIYRIFP